MKLIDRSKADVLAFAASLNLEVPEGATKAQAVAAIESVIGPWDDDYHPVNTPGTAEWEWAQAAAQRDSAGDVQSGSVSDTEAEGGN